MFAALLLSFGFHAVGHSDKSAMEVHARYRVSSSPDGSFVRNTGNVFMPQPAPAVGLTMADFTGDTHPDLATVELDRVDSSNALYSIQIRLTEGRSQTLTFTAPFGGLT